MITVLALEAAGVGSEPRVLHDQPTGRTLTAWHTARTQRATSGTAAAVAGWATGTTADQALADLDQLRRDGIADGTWPTNDPTAEPESPPPSLFD